MKKLGRLRLNEKGFTLVELMLVTALIGIITPAITFLFMKLSQGMAADEMHTQLQALNEQTLLRLHERLVAGRHVCQGDVSGQAYLTKVTAGLSATTTTNYPVLAGSLLPVGQPPAVVPTPSSFSPVFSVRADFGNSLLFAGYDGPQTMGNPAVPYISPVSIFTSGGVPITFSAAFGGVPTTIVMDLYRFYYYYLTSKNPKQLRDTTTYRLIEWQSIQYADYNEIQDIADGTLRQAAISWLGTPGNPSPGNPTLAVTCAWDPTASDPTASAFFKLNPATGVASAINPVSITEAFVTPLTRVSSGILSTGFMYGIAPNSATWSGTPQTVPQFGTAAGNFPGGFEVGILGTSAGREVLTRFLLVAQGGSPKIVWNDATMIHNVRDVW